MEKKAKFFRNVIANTVIAVVLGLTVAVIAIPNGKVVSADDAIKKGNTADLVSVAVSVQSGTEYLDDMLHILSESGVQTTFFVSGTWAGENNSALKKIREAGHELGSHGFFIKDHKKLSSERCREEILLTHKLVQSVAGVEMSLFSPPDGSYSGATVKTAKELGYRTVICRISADRTPVVSELSGGDIVALIPSEKTVANLPLVLKAIGESGLKIATVGEVIGGIDQ